MDNEQPAKLDYKLSKVPDVGRLRRQYDYTIAQLGHYTSKCKKSYDDRRCNWLNKTNDLRKSGKDAFPWEGASDVEVPLINEKISTYVALCMSALNRANIRAYPVASDDIDRAKLASSFLKWMVHSYIERFKQEMEQNCNYMFEKGIMVTYVGWQREERSFLQELNLDQIAEIAPELAEAIMSGTQDTEIINLFRQQFPNLVDKRARKAIRELRKTGVAELPISRTSVDAPCVKACPPDSDVFFPPLTLDPQQAPYIFYRVLMTAQEIEGKVKTEGWDREWADYVIDNYRGVTGLNVQSEWGSRQAAPLSRADNTESEFIEVVYVYQRLIDDEDGSEGIYRTVIHPRWTGDDFNPKFAKFELLNGLEDYPFVVTPIGEDSRSLYDVQTFSDLLRGIQWQVKVERDQRIDAASLRVLPPIMHPEQRPPQEWGPGRYVPYRRPGELHFGPTPPPDTASYNIEQVLIQQGDKLIGLDEESTTSPFKKQYFVDKFLSHVRDVLKMAWKSYLRWGPEETYFRVTGMTNPEKMVKIGDEQLDIFVNFDTQNNDPETVEKKLSQLVQLLALDRNGKIKVDDLLEVAGAAIDPVLADAILQPTEVAMEEITRQVTDDIAKIFAGMEMPARPQGAQVALGIVQQYAQQPDVAQRLQSDEAFAERLQKYGEQYQFQLQQAQNAQIGRIGTAPASVGQSPTQNVNMQ